MNLIEKNTGKISDLEAYVHARVSKREFGKALEAIQTFATDIILDPASVGRIFVSPELDKLCKYIGEEKVVNTVSDQYRERSGTVILASEISKVGGHTELIKDIVRLQIFDGPVSLVLTDFITRVEPKLLFDFSNEYKIPIKVSRGENPDVKFTNTLHLIYSCASKRLVLLNNNEDSSLVAAAFAAKAAGWINEVVYIHHGDHHLSLGASSVEFIHIDPHQMGYFQCKNEFGNRPNRYWPLTVNIDKVPTRVASFMSTGCLVTCSSGRAEKFEQGAYLYDYWTLIPQFIARGKGVHIHIGELLSEQYERLCAEMSLLGLSIDRFVHIPWVDSVARALVEYKVDLYISSFPLGGGKATLEAMASGTPLLMHESYLSRFHGGVDIAYPDAFVWRDESEFLSVLNGLDGDVLLQHSIKAKAHFDKFHDKGVLIKCCDFSHSIDEKLIPPLRVYRVNTLQRYLAEFRHKVILQDKARLELAKYETQAQVMSAELANYEVQAQVMSAELAKYRICKKNAILNPIKQWAHTLISKLLCVSKK
jgi:hypothetical protein